MNTWDREHFTRTGASALLHYTVFGEFGELPPMSASAYRSSGMREGWELVHVADRATLDDYTVGFATPWEWFERDHADAASAVRQAPHALVLHAEQPDAPDLTYLRDALGLIAFLLDHGGIAVCDPQTLSFHPADAWRQRFFASDHASPADHVVILSSDHAEGRVWLHTRGLRKFARPDLSVLGVPRDCLAQAEALVNRFIALQAAGGVVPEGQEVAMAGLPTGLVCRHRGHLDDPAFNNVHLALEWPA